MEKLHGWLVVNGFLSAKRFVELYKMLRADAVSLGMELEIKSTVELVRMSSKRVGRVPDFVLFWDKDVILANQIENMGIPVFNKAHAIEVCDSKAKTAVALDKCGIPQPETLVAPMTFDGIGYCDLLFLEAAEERFGYPYVIKEAHGSFGQQVHLVGSRQAAEELARSFDSRPFIMQEFVETSLGRDVRINIVGGEPVASILRYNEKDFRSNLAESGQKEKYTPSKEQIEIAVAASKAIGLDFCGVDLLFGEDGPLVCEVNSNMHFKKTYECTGVDVGEHILKYISDKIS